MKSPRVRPATVAFALHEVALPLLVLAALVSASAGHFLLARLSLAVLLVQSARLWLADADLSLLFLKAVYGVPSNAFAGQPVWIVGASQGMGELVALRLARGGASLILSSRNEAALTRVAAACLAAGASAAHVLPLDQLSKDGRAAAIKSLSEIAPDGLHHVFLLAGGTQRAAALATTPEVDLAVVTLNALSVYALAKAVVPRLRPGCGRVTAVASAAALLPSPGQASYAGSKFCVVGFLSTLRSEGAVNVTIVSPGPVATGQPGQPRLTFGEGGGKPVSPAAATEAARVPAPRAAELLVTAAHFGVAHAWIAKHPVLLLLYASRFCGGLADAVIDRAGPKRVRAAVAGGDMYTAAGRNAA